MQNISAAVHLGQTPDVDNKNSVAAHLTLKVVHRYTFRAESCMGESILKYYFISFNSILAGRTSAVQN